MSSPRLRLGTPGGQAAEAGLAQRCTHSAWLHSRLQTPGPQRAGSVQRAAWLAGPPKGPGTAPAPRAQPALHLPSSPLCGLRGQSCWEGAQRQARPGQVCSCSRAPEMLWEDNDEGGQGYPSTSPSQRPPGRARLARACAAPPPPGSASPRRSWALWGCLHGNHWSGNLPVYPPASGVAQASPWQQPWESCPSQETAQNLSLPSAAPAGRGPGGRAAKAGLETQPEDAWAARQDPPSACHPGPCGWTDRRPGLGCSRAPPGGWGAARPRLEPGRAYSWAWLSGVWCQLVLPSCRASPRPPSRARGYLPTPWLPHPAVLRACAPAKPHCRSSCHCQLSPRSIPSAHPHRPSKTPLPTAGP